MNIGDVVLVMNGSMAKTASGTSFRLSYTVAIKVTDVSWDGRVCWVDKGQTFSTDETNTRPLGCVWILGLGTNTPMRIQKVIQEPLKAFGLDVVIIPRSRVSGLVNVPKDMDRGMVVQAVFASLVVAGIDPSIIRPA